MRWGHRKKSERLNKKQQSRDHDYTKRKVAAKKSRQIARQAQRELDDLNKNGYNSKTWKNNKDYAQYWQEVYGTKKQALDSLKSDYSKAIQARKTEAYNLDKLAESIKQTPLNKKTYLDTVRKRNKIRNGVQMTGTILGIAGSAALGSITKSPSVAVGSMITTGLLGGYATSKIGTTEIDQYNKRNKNNKLDKNYGKNLYFD